jgi:quercetin dioxygenase-like cupin family protein
MMGNDSLVGLYDLNEVIGRFPPDPGSVARHRAETLIKTSTLRVVLVTMLTGGEMHQHAAPGPITIQVLRGSIRLTMDDITQDLGAGQLISLAGGVEHAVDGVEDGAFLLTIAHLDHTPDPGGS